MTQMSLHIIVISISMLASLTLYFQKNTPFYLKTFPVFLIIMIGVELTGLWLTKNRITNAWLFNWFTTVEFVYYLYILRCIIVSAKVKKLIGILMVLYPVVVFFNIYFVLRHTQFHTVTYSIGCLLVAAICVYYFFELFQLSKSTTLVREPAFWICSGLLFFYCCSFPLFGMWNLLNSVSNVIIRNIDYILKFLNTLLYSMFTIGFLCRLRVKKPGS